jgi:glycerophosphoryl diester phosphodiesterase
MHLPELVAHRGYTLHYPENTLPAIDAAVRAGARYVEVDIQLTADQVPVLFHDRNLQRLCGTAGQVHEFPWGRLRELRASDFGRFGYRFAQTPIATLAELVALLQRHPKVHAFVEIKRVAVERFGADVVLRRVVPELRAVLRQCTLISYSVEFLRAARRSGYPSLGAILERWGQRKLEAVRQLHAEYLFCDEVDLPRWGRLQVEGSKLAVYEITDPALAQRLARRGVDLVETFAIGEMLAQFAQRRAGAA